MPKAWLSELGEKLPQIALAMLAAKRGGPEASAAFMNGLQESADRRQALTRQAQLDEERRGLQTQQLAFQQRQEAREGRQDTRQGQQDARSVEQEKYQKVMNAVKYLTELPPEALGANNISSATAAHEKLAGMAPGSLSEMMGPQMSVRKAEAARKWAADKLGLIEKTRKSYEDRGQAFDDSSVSYRWEDVPEPVQALALAQGHPNGPDGKPEPVKLSQLEMLGGLPSFRTTSRPDATEGKSDLDRTYQRMRQEFIAEYGRTPSPKEDVALDRKSREESKVVTPVDPSMETMRGLNIELARQRVEAGSANAGALPPRRQSQVTIKQRSFDAAAVTKRVQTMAEAVTFTKNLDPNTTNPADDQGLIYAFAKAMDPESVVREGEYATVQKYAQAWAESMGFNAARVFSNTPFLTAQARLNMKATIASRFGATKQQYDNLRREYAGQIDKITGGTDGESYLVDYAAGFSGSDGTIQRWGRDANGKPVKVP